MAEITAPTPDSAKKQVGRRPDLATLGGLALALVGILGGLVLEQGKVRDVAQLTAAIIVLGGTLGAVMVTTPMALLRSAAGKFPAVLFETSHAPGAVIEQIIGYATKARKNGIVSLEEEAGTIEDPFLRKALNLAVDGTDLQELRRMMELEISLEEHRGEAEAKVYEAAGGYAPTIGIIGAVLGLIQVMQHLQDINEVGRGIAVAFVATVYGVGIANLFLLPVAGKMRLRIRDDVQRREMMLEGVISILEGMNPRILEMKLAGFLQSSKQNQQERAA
jgi:chemotaxis protein MotA